MSQVTLKKMVINNVVGNVLGHAGITYWVKHEIEAIPAGGVQGWVADFLTTGFMFPAILFVIMFFVFRSANTKNNLVIEELDESALLDKLPDNGWTACLWVGLAGMVTVALPLAVFLSFSGLQPLSPLSVSLLKGSWAGVIAAISVYAAYYLITTRGLTSRT
ncbi:MAG: hypothetical protein AAGI11_03595 [Pseudomonadota bacterium]